MKYHKEYILHRELKDVSNIFKDIKSYGSYHPLIKSVEFIQDEKNGIEKYKIKEQPFNLIPIKIQYLASVHLYKNLIRYKIHGIPFLSPRIEYELFRKDETTTRLNFNLIIEGLPVVRNILMKKMIKEQDALIDTINKKTNT